MLKKLFKKEPEKDIVKVAVPCACDGDNEHCDLISRLRKHQDLRKEIKNEIETLNNSRGVIYGFIGFLKELERNGLYMDVYNKYITNSCNDSYNIRIIESVIDSYSSADIFRITEELRTYRNKMDIIREKQRALKAVEDDIKIIKSKLGIE